MNKLTIIGNLTRDPEARQTADGRDIASFTVAVNRRTQKDHPEADYFRVTCWDKLALIAVKYLDKGKKVCVIGPVRVNAYENKEGKAAASLEVTAHDLELLSPRPKAEGQEAGAQVDAQSGFQQVDKDELPF